MPRLHPIKNNFTAGELSPLMLARTDFDRYNNGAVQLENFVTLIQGGIQSRPGTRFVAEVKDATQPVRVVPFEASVSAAYILEVGNLYMRFYRDGGRLEVSGVPVEISTPYAGTQVFGLRFAQNNDVLYIAHPSFPTYRLTRASDTSWSLVLVPFSPPPVFEGGFTNSATLTLSATSGTVTVVASSATFLGADTDRVLISGGGRGSLTVVTNPTTATMTVTDAFASTSLAPGTWLLDGSPNATLRPSITGPRGATVTVSLERVQTGATELLTNGTFATDLTGWVNQSAPTLTTGTHNGATNNANLVDTTKNFITLGVLPTHLVRNETDGGNASVAGVAQTSLTLGLITGGGDNDFDTGDSYTVKRTGAATVSGGAALLTGGTAGVGWIEQSITTVAASLYSLSFTVSGQSLSAMVGSSSLGQQLLPEASYGVGAHTVTWTATGVTSYVQFRNNQNNQASVSQASVKLGAAEGFRTTDVGKYIKAQSGLIRLTAYVNGVQMTGEIIRSLSSSQPVGIVAGAWSLEELAWSAAYGYPTTLCFSEQRLWFGRGQQVWGSVTGDYENFTAGTNPDDSPEYRLASNAFNPIQWMASPRTLLLGTLAETSRLAGVNGGAVTPTSVQVLTEETVGSAETPPVRLGNTVLFMQRQHVALLELGYDGNNDAYTPDEVSKLSEHLFLGYTIIEMAYEFRQPAVLWLVRSDGTLLGCTYYLRERIAAWHRHTTQGAYESVARISRANTRGSETWVVARRLAGARRYIERMDDTLHLDSALTYSGVATSTLTGLSHLEGQTVSVVGNGAAYPIQTVSAGQITGITPAVTTAVVGLPFTCTAVIPRPEVQQAVGTAQQSQKRYGQVSARLYNTVGLTIQGETVPFRQSTDPMDQAVPPFTGDKRILNLGWDRDATLTIQQTQAFAATVLGLFGTLVTGD